MEGDERDGIVHGVLEPLSVERSQSYHTMTRAKEIPEHLYEQCHLT